jgi:hypothetical protein
MSNNFTPGPWTVGIADWSEDGNARYEITSQKHICAPDARLIAAAPELLKALKSLCEHAEDGDVPCWIGAWDVARAVVAKATGQAS